MIDLSYTPNQTEAALQLYGMVPNKIYLPQGLESTAISYVDNQPTDLLLWDSNFCSIFIFSRNKYLEGDVKNIAYSLSRIMIFIRQ